MEKSIVDRCAQQKCKKVEQRIVICTTARDTNFSIAVSLSPLRLASTPSLFLNIRVVI